MTLARVSSCLVALAVLFNATSARRLPNGITPCSKDEPDLNRCAIINGRAAIPNLWRGIPSYGVPVLDPLRIDVLDIAEPPADSPKQVSLALKMTDVDVVGLRNTELQYAKIDLAKEKMSWKLTIPRLSLLGKYVINGKVLLLPLRGRGDMNITLDNLNVHYAFDMGLAPGKKGEIYLNPKNAKLDFDTSRAYINLENLFDGDKALSARMNEFLDENWRELVSELGPPIAEALNQVLTSMMTNIARTVPYKEIFPETARN
ncbi:protein takeout-like [Neocloeon triangulifer]|uniref:protein takeout-like n=1 Tax=Neocloeon triangulifer TaxID=2078957 RepID=UPI00286F94F7|nr:protein takeout-like [Neocloeon triangulifer]